MHSIDHLAELAKALAHPARLRTLGLLGTTPGCICGDGVGAVGRAQSTGSEHQRSLNEADVITGEIYGSRVCHALNPAGLAPLPEVIASLAPPPGDVGCIPTQEEAA